MVKFSCGGLMVEACLSLDCSFFLHQLSLFSGGWQILCLKDFDCNKLSFLQQSTFGYLKAVGDFTLQYIAGFAVWPIKWHGDFPGILQGMAMWLAHCSLDCACTGCKMTSIFYCDTQASLKCSTLLKLGTISLMICVVFSCTGWSIVVTCCSSSDEKEKFRWLKLSSTGFVITDTR